MRRLATAVSSTACFGSLLAAAACGGGSDAVGPGGGGGGGGGGDTGRPGLQIVAGAGGTDTAVALQAIALQVSVRDGSGRAVPGTVVRFTALSAKNASGGMAPSMYVGDIAGAGVGPFLADTTDASGRAYARIQFGSVAGPGTVVISAPTAGLEDTARYTVQPGSPARVVLPIADTTLAVGRSLALNGSVQDRFGNARPDALTFTVVGSGISVSSGQVNTSIPARAAVVGRLSTGTFAPDTTWVSVVPVATVAAKRGTKLVTVNLDGTGLVQLPHTLEVGEGGPVWHPSGQSLLATLGSYEVPFSLFRVDLGGGTQRVLATSYPSAKGFSVPGTIRGFAYAPTGDWVYLAGNNCNSNAILYRVPVASPDALDRLSESKGDGVDECFDLFNNWPSVSPDGTRLVYENQTGYLSGYSLRVLNIAAKLSVPLTAGGQRPQWAPTGDRIAYWKDKQIWVIDNGGYNDRAISPPGRNYAPGVTWSPDGEWLLARFEPSAGWAGTTVALLNVNSGLEIPLPWTTSYGGIQLPSWKPKP